MANAYRVGPTSARNPVAARPGAPRTGLASITSDPVTTKVFQTPLLRTAAPTFLYPGFGRDPDLSAPVAGAGGKGATPGTGGTGGAGNGGGAGAGGDPNGAGGLGLGGTPITSGLADSNGGDGRGGVGGGVGDGRGTGGTGTGDGRNATPGLMTGVAPNTNNPGPTNAGGSGLAPGRTNLGTALGALPGIGLAGSLGNMANGAVRGIQAADMVGQLTGQAPGFGGSLLAAGRGALGLGGDPTSAFGEAAKDRGLGPDQADQMVQGYTQTGSINQGPAIGNQNGGEGAGAPQGGSSPGPASDPGPGPGPSGTSNADPNASQGTGPAAGTEAPGIAGVGNSTGASPGANNSAGRGGGKGGAAGPSGFGGPGTDADPTAGFAPSAPAAPDTPAPDIGPPDSPPSVGTPDLGVPSDMAEPNAPEPVGAPDFAAPPADTPAPAIDADPLGTGMMMSQNPNVEIVAGLMSDMGDQGDDAAAFGGPGMSDPGDPTAGFGDPGNPGDPNSAPGPSADPGSPFGGAGVDQNGPMGDPSAGYGGGPGGGQGGDAGGGQGGGGNADASGGGPGGQGGDAGGFAFGGPVTADRLGGPNPPGPDDGYAGLDHGEFVVNQQAAGQYGNILREINAGTYQPGAEGGGMPTIGPGSSDTRGGAESVAFAGLDPAQGGPNDIRAMTASTDMSGMQDEASPLMPDDGALTPDQVMMNMAGLMPDQRAQLSTALSDPGTAGALMTLLGPAFGPALQAIMGGDMMEAAPMPPPAMPPSGGLGGLMA